MITQSIFPPPNIEIEEKPDVVFSGDPDIPSYDSDGDGVADTNDSHPFDAALAQSIVGGAPIEEWNNTPALTLIVPKPLDHSEFPTNMAWGDIDNDGDADLLLATADGRNQIWFNDGDGNMVLSWIEPMNYAYTWSSELADINGDGWLDAIFSNYDIPSYMIFNNNGSFNNSPDWNTSGTIFGTGMGVGDLDGDNDIDVYFASHSDEIYLNNNSNLSNITYWQEPETAVASGNLGSSIGYTTTFGLELGDFDRDGDVDIIQANGWCSSSCSGMTSQIEGYLMHWTNNGNGTFGDFNSVGGETNSWASWYANVTMDIELADLDGDGYFEIIVADDWRWSPSMGYVWNAPNHIYSNNNGSFSRAPSWSSAQPTPSVAVDSGDIDMDGDIDLVFANGFPEQRNENGGEIIGRNVSDNVYTNNNGTITSMPTWSTENVSTVDVKIVDYDGDKDLDIVFSRHDINHTNTIEFYENPWSNVDKDDWGDDEDACPLIAGNSTEDRLGCPDSDGDGWSDADSEWTWGMGADRFVNNPDQHADGDGDGWGDNSNGTDGDVCPEIWGNSTQGGVLGCIDSDGDDWADTIDWDVSDPTQWADDDSDSYGDNPNGTNGDDCPGEWGNSTEGGVLGCMDSDGDGWGDAADWSSSDASQWADSDSDGYGDESTGTQGDDCNSTWGNSTENGTLGCIDNDGDGWAESDDWLPTDKSQWIDEDDDGWGDNPNGTNGDACPGVWGNSTQGDVLGCIDSDGDDWADIVDAFINESSQWTDWDSDGYGDNQNGANADDCPDQFGVSYLDVLGCADWDADGVSNTNDPAPLDASLAIDDDNDNIDNSIDNCPSISNVNQEDYDLDQIGDVCDDDDDGDSISDTDDLCQMGEKNWLSEPEGDIDSDGCRDLTEDNDDDGDGIVDGADLCANTAATYTGWTSTNGSGNASNITDWDGDGCEDASGEDLDDDNDGVEDPSDLCRYSPHGWKSTPSTDEESDGCVDTSQDTDGDGTIDKYDQCPNTGENATVDDKGCSVTQNADFQRITFNDGDNMSFSEKLISGDLDAVGLLLAVFLPVIGVALTIMFQQRKRAHLKRLRKLILNAETKSQLHEAKALLRKSVSDDKLTQAQYNLLLEEIENLLEQFELGSKINTKETKKKGEGARTKSKEEWHKAVAEELQDTSYRVDDEGVEWWEDEKKLWWYRQPGDDRWSKWIE